MNDSDRFLSLEEEFHGRDRKLSREERKMAIRQDRSKHKKTDQDQRKKQHIPIESLPTDVKQGRVLSISSEEVQVSSEGKVYACQIRGSLKKDKSDKANLLAIGDFVYFEPKQQLSIIFKIAPRHSILSRADNLSQKKQQLIAANVDQVIITASVASPPLKPSLLDRFIIAALKGNMKPIIVINKIDLLAKNPKEEELLSLCKKAYTTLQIPFLTVSLYTKEGIEELKHHLQGKTSVFSGQSGTGKSSLINAITGSHLKIGEIISKTAKGSHTTTSSSLIPLENGGFCIDTPGIRSFGIWGLEAHEIKTYFKEIASFATDCLFPNCSHKGEEGCSVEKAVQEEKISPLRLHSYFALQDTLQKEHRSR